MKSRNHQIASLHYQFLWNTNYYFYFSLILVQRQSKVVLSKRWNEHWKLIGARLSTELLLYIKYHGHHKLFLHNFMCKGNSWRNGIKTFTIWIWCKSFQIRPISFRAPNSFVIMLLDANIHTLRCWTMLQNVWTLSMKKNQFNCSRHNTAAKLLILALSNNHSLTLIKTNQLCAVY